MINKRFLIGIVGVILLTLISVVGYIAYTSIFSPTEVPDVSVEAPICRVMQTGTDTNQSGLFWGQETIDTIETVIATDPDITAAVTDRLNQVPTTEDISQHDVIFIQATQAFGAEGPRFIADAVQAGKQIVITTDHCVAGSASGAWCQAGNGLVNQFGIEYFSVLDLLRRNFGIGMPQVYPEFGTPGEQLPIWFTTVSTVRQRANTNNDRYANLVENYACQFRYGNNCIWAEVEFTTGAKMSLFTGARMVSGGDLPGAEKTEVINRLLSAYCPEPPLTPEPPSINKEGVISQIDSQTTVIDYTVTVTNTDSDQSLTDAEVVDTPPTYATVIEASISNGGSYNSGINEIRWDIDTINPSAVLTLTYQISLNNADLPNDNVVSNSAEVLIDGEPQDTVTEEIPIDVPDEPDPPEITKNNTAVRISGNQVEIDYSVTVSNLNDSEITDVFVIDVLPSYVDSVNSISNGGIFDGAMQVEWGGLTVPAASNLQLTYTAVFDTSTLPLDTDNNVIISNSATVYIDEDNDGNPDPEEEENTTTEDTEIDLDADAQVAKSVTTLLDANDNLVADYTINISNTGSAPISNYTVTDVFGDNVSSNWVSNISNDGQLSNDRLTWTGLDLAIGQNLLLTYTITYPQNSPGVYNNLATLTDENNNIVDEDGVQLVVEYTPPINSSSSSSSSTSSSSSSSSSVPSSSSSSSSSISSSSSSSSTSSSTPPPVPPADTPAPPPTPPAGSTELPATGIFDDFAGSIPLLLGLGLLTIGLLINRLNSRFETYTSEAVNNAYESIMPFEERILRKQRRSKKEKN